MNLRAYLAQWLDLVHVALLDDLLAFDLGGEGSELWYAVATAPLALEAALVPAPPAVMGRALTVDAPQGRSCLYLAPGGLLGLDGPSGPVLGAAAVSEALLSWLRAAGATEQGPFPCSI